jgi:hypothetical protein
MTLQRVSTGGRNKKTFLCQKPKVKVQFTLEQATKAQREVEAQLYSFFNLGARWGGWSAPRPGRVTPGKYPVPVV